MANPLLDAALAYAARGWAVFPVHSINKGGCSCGKSCEHPGKHPRTARGFKDASTDAATIRAWWTRWPDANIGIATGGVFWALDVDPRHRGDAALAELERVHGALPGTWVSKTGGGGCHYLFAPDPRIGTSRGGLPDGIDVKGRGGYIIAPESRTTGGYAWLVGHGPDDLPLATAPPWLVALILNGKQRTAGIDGARIPLHTRNATLTSLAGKMRRPGMTRDEMYEALRAINTRRCDPPLTDKEVAAIAQSVSRYPTAAERVAMEPVREPQFPTDESPSTFVTASSLIAEPTEDVRWLVDGLLPAGGLSVLAAKVKVGKSTLMRLLCFCVATGRPFLGRATIAGPVLYVALEDRRADVKHHLKLLGAPGDLPLHVHVGPPPRTEDPVAWLKREVQKYRATLVGIDPLGRLLRGVKDLNDYAQVTAATDPLIALGHETGAHIAFTHHAKKGEAEGADALLGSTAVAGFVDSLLIERRGRDGTRTFETIQRSGDDLPESVLVLDKATGMLSLGGSIEEHKREAAIHRVCVVLGPGPLDEATIRERAGMGANETSEVLRAAVRQGRIVRSGIGKKGHPYLYAVKDEREIVEHRAVKDVVSVEHVEHVEHVEDDSPLLYALRSTDSLRLTAPGTREPGEEG